MSLGNTVLERVGREFARIYAKEYLMIITHYITK